MAQNREDFNRLFLSGPAHAARDANRRAAPEHAVSRARQKMVA
jgi:hypothetical protein